MAMCDLDLNAPPIDLDSVDGNGEPLFLTKGTQQRHLGNLQTWFMHNKKT
jgi:hypothetical protein